VVRSRSGFREEGIAVVLHQLSDSFQCDVCLRVSRKNFRIERVVALFGKNRGDFAAPDFLYFRQNADFVVDQDVMIGREAAFHVVQFFFLVNIDEHVAIHRLINPGALNLARLEDNVAVRKNCRRAPLFDVLNGVERIGIQARGERIVDEKV
jgi:hypothetical protein